MPKRHKTRVIRVREETYRELKRLKKDGEKMADIAEKHMRSLFRVY